MKGRLIEIAFKSMEEHKKEHINNDTRYIKADARVKELLKDIGAELPGEKKHLIDKLEEELGGQADRRDDLIYELGLKQGVVLKIAETDIKKALKLNV